MSILAEASIILLTALYSKKPCIDVFKEITLSQMKETQIALEKDYVHELASEACRTNNPDIIWQIAQVETAFQFRILRFNNSKGTVLKGDKAEEFLKNLKKSKRRTNIDIGVMQVNWYWHHKNFESDPIAMMQPKNQVQYLVRKLGPIVYRTCRRQWIGCYHNPANGDHAKRYNSVIKRSRKNLKIAALRFLKRSIHPEPPKIGSFLTQKEIIKFYNIANNHIHPRLSFIVPSGDEILISEQDKNHNIAQETSVNSPLSTTAKKSAIFMKKRL